MSPRANHGWEEAGGKPGDKEFEVPRDFYLGRYEVTQGEWEAVMGGNPSHFSRQGIGKNAVKDFSDDELKRFPVEMVSWDDAQQFLAKLNEREKQAGWTYRLPTESEWECACREGTQASKEASAFRYYFEEPTDTLLLDKANFYEVDLRRSCRVGSYPANRLGLCDMHGNLGEWTHDEVPPGVKDPPGISIHMSLGGGWNTPAPRCTAASRWRHPATDHVFNLGLRVARIPVGAPSPAMAPFDANSAQAHQKAWAAHLDKPVEFENSLGMKFRLVPPGEFDIGSTEEQIAEYLKGNLSVAPRRDVPSEGPRHHVRITKPLYVGVHEVTVKAFRAFVEATGYKTEAESSGGGLWLTSEGAFERDPLCSWRNPGWKIDDNEPVVCLGAPDATEFCQWLARQDGRPWRLPTEAEWEYFARAGTTTDYHTGSSLTEKQANFANAKRGTTPVGSYPPNPFGLHDIHGNVWEWCSDWFDSEYYRAAPLDDPPGPMQGRPIKGKTSQVMRGGGWYLGEMTARSAYRGWSPVIVTDHGLRIVCEADVKPPPSAKAPFDAAQAKAHQEAWGKCLGAPVEVTNSVGMKLRLIPPGEFEMGSSEKQIGDLVSSEENARNKGNLTSEGPLHKVVLSRPFLLGVCEVSQAQYEQVIGSNPAFYNASKGGGPNHPVDKVDWKDAVDFCERLSALPEEQKAGRRYRLPTEAQWEFACRAGTTTAYSFGETATTAEANFQNGRTVSIGSYPPNAFGLHDMHGNLREWCSDWYSETYYQESPSLDPSGPATGDTHCVRSGSWGAGPRQIRSASRRQHLPVDNMAINGFRVTCEVGPVPGGK